MLHRSMTPTPAITGMCVDMQVDPEVTTDDLTTGLTYYWNKLKDKQFDVFCRLNFLLIFGPITTLLYVSK